VPSSRGKEFIYPEYGSKEEEEDRDDDEDDDGTDPGKAAGLLSW
jgi:hypothetical protein